MEIGPIFFDLSFFHFKQHHNFLPCHFKQKSVSFFFLPKKIFYAQLCNDRIFFKGLILIDWCNLTYLADMYDLYTLIYVMYALLALELSNTCICILGACFMNRSWAFISWLIGEKVKAKGGGWPWYPPWCQILIEVEFHILIWWRHFRGCTLFV